MHSTSCVVVLSVVLVYLCGVLSAYPQPLTGVTAIRPPSRGTGSRAGTRFSTTKNPNKVPPKKKKPEEGDAPKHEDEPLHEAEIEIDSPDSDGTGEDDRDSSGCKGTEPLSQQFAAGLGHGCEIIADAFNDCNSGDGYYCSGNLVGQTSCLCKQKPHFHAHLKSCYSFLRTRYPQAARNIEAYTDNRYTCPASST